MGNLSGARIAIALTGSFCTLQAVFDVLPALRAAGAELTPILSGAVVTMDTRFFTARKVRETIEDICGRAALTTIPEVEPIGPKRMFDLIVVAPCTGNTCAKLSLGIADTSVTMACKSQLRNQRPVLIGLATNDALAAGARNMGVLMARKQIYFIPLGQDDPAAKPSSMVFHASRLQEAAGAALAGRQLQPLLVAWGERDS